MIPLHLLCYITFIHVTSNSTHLINVQFLHARLKMSHGDLTLYHLAVSNCVSVQEVASKIALENLGGPIFFGFACKCIIRN